MPLIKEIDYGTPERESEAAVTLEIDGQTVSVPAGTSIMRAAMETGAQDPQALRHRQSSRPSAPAGSAWWRSRAGAARPPPAPRWSSPA